MRETGNESVIVHHVDLSSFKSVRDFAATINVTESKIDVLIHNAGYVDYLKKSVSVDGVETTMATNHYGPFLLTHLLIDLLKKSAPCRIVVVASKTHTWSFMNPLKQEHLNPVNFLIPGLLYGNSKLANFLFTYELARRLEKFNITVNCLHPGVVDTGIWRNIPLPFSLVMAFARLFQKNLQEGCQTILYCTMSSDLENVTGKYFRDCREGTPKKTVYNRNWQSVMWEESKRIVKLGRDDPKITSVLSLWERP